MKNLKFDGTQLKYIAIIAMTIDHLAWLLYPGLVKEPIPVLMAHSRAFNSTNYVVFYRRRMLLYKRY